MSQRRSTPSALVVLCVLQYCITADVRFEDDDHWGSDAQTSCVAHSCHVALPLRGQSSAKIAAFVQPHSFPKRLMCGLLIIMLVVPWTKDYFYQVAVRLMCSLTTRNQSPLFCSATITFPKASFSLLHVSQVITTVILLQVYLICFDQVVLSGLYFFLSTG